MSEKEKYEIEALQASTRSMRLTLLFTFVTTAIVAANFLVDLYRTRAAETGAALEKRLERMRTIAAEFDNLYGTSITTMRLDRDRVEQLQYAMNRLDSAHTELQRNASRELSEVRDAVTVVQEQLNSSIMLVDVRERERALAEVWIGRKASLTADFPLVYSEAIAARWPELRAAVVDIYDEKFSAFSSDADIGRKIARFDQLASEFQAAMRREIHKFARQQ